MSYTIIINGFVYITDATVTQVEEVRMEHSDKDCHMVVYAKSVRTIKNNVNEVITKMNSGNTRSS